MNLPINLERMKLLTSKLRDKYPELSERDLIISNNTETDILRMVAYKPGKTKQEMSEIVKEL